MDKAKQIEGLELRAVLKGKVPSKKNRYKIANGRIYMDPDVKGFIESAAWAFKEQRSPYSVLPWKHPVAVHISFLTDRKSDLDNMVATIFDALQEAGIIENDRQIMGLTASKEFSGFHITKVWVRSAA